MILIMLAPVSSSASARTDNRSKQNGATHQQTKRRVVRRRGRARADLDSDEEIEREARTDSDSDDEEEDDLSSLDGSSSDSDTEPVSEDVLPNGHTRVLTPSTSQSPGETAEDVKVNDHGQSSFFAASGTWSEMVAEETLNGPADLPVIDFAQLDRQTFPATTTPPRKTKKTKKSQRPAPSSSSAAAAAPSSPVPTVDDTTPQPSESPAPASTSSSRGRPFPRRPPGQTARQAYQQRLEVDPSYVPVVGEFWGHDDRLMNKELRSLSTWWRGRWQGRGRGRGFMRGRGGFGAFGRQEGQVDGEDASQVPPVDRAWGHDGFEEMRKIEESRRVVQEQQQRQAHSPTGFRGGFAGARGRGGFARGVRGGRGGFSMSSRGRGMSHGHPPDRVWYAMKPEFMWTKQHDSFLYTDSHPKSRPNQTSGVRVKLPGAKKEAVVEVKANSSTVKPATELAAPAASSSAAGSDVGERSLVVRLPKREPASKAVDTKPTGPSIDEVFTVRPRLISPKPIPLPESPSALSQPVANGMPTVDPIVQQRLEQISIEPQESDPARYAQTEEAVLRHPTSSEEHQQQQQPPQVHHPVPAPSEQRPSLVPLHTNFVQPPSQGSPGYGSPYTYPASLPPGVAMNPAGMPYEIATGRPVYIPSPNMPTIYTPPPMMQQPPPPHFVPGHIHHHSAMSSSDFLPPGTPPGGYMEYAPMAPPMFSLPRQSSGIKIRAPDGNPVNLGPTSPGTASGSVEKPSSTRLSKPTHLRHNAAVFEPLRLGSSRADTGSTMPEPESEQNSSQEFLPQYDPNSSMGYGQSGYSNDYPGGGGGENETPGEDQQQQQQQEQMMGYQPYPQYYYPEQYGYNPYLDMSQVGQYEAYPFPVTTSVLVLAYTAKQG
ncbi:hypothetical protein D9758_004883 [Tetrapyrgos nigripes]|uniref:Btz domain-containing protein n=1 Tax=Tetrapyrgos nigripes TaxID=182062 RepID=A0A8H5G5V7_9AGAR|nr:hypothetical protein D9758_004883 [Tetrapyrgos nigripes]